MAGTASRRTQLLSITEAAAQLSCSRGHIYNLIAAGALAAVEISTPGSHRSKTRVRATDLEAYIEQHTRVA
jgi:excisionase family DNA binding protein